MGGPGGYRTMTEEEMQDLFGNQDPFSDFFNTFFGGGGAGAREGGALAQPRQPHAEGPRHRARRRADARGGVPRRDASHLDQTGRPREERRRAHSGRRQGRVARPRRRRGRIGQQRRLRPAICICACRRARTRSSSARATTCTRPSRAGHDRGPRRRGTGADDYRHRCGSRFPRRRRAARCSA